MVYGRETAPDTGRKHLQGFVYFKCPRSFPSVQKQFKPRHVEKSVAPLEAITYCQKEGDFTERGTKPDFRAKSRSEKGALASKENFRDFIALSRKGDFETLLDKHPGLAVSHYRTMWALQKDFRPMPSPLTHLENYWFWGPAGTGKSHRARHMFGDRSVYVKGPTKWWDGYNAEEIVVIDDLGSQHDWMVDHLKVWADKYPFNAEMKGGMMRIRPKIIIVTSNRSIAQLFGDKYSVDLEPLWRRFTEESMDEKFVEPDHLSVPDSDLHLLDSLNADFAFP